MRVGATLESVEVPWPVPEGRQDILLATTRPHDSREGDPDMKTFEPAVTEFQHEENIGTANVATSWTR